MRRFVSKNINNFKPCSLPDRPIDIEIGCGVGLHPIRYATRHGDRFLIAIEHTLAKFDKFRRRLLSHPPITNLMPVHDNAIYWIDRHIALESISKFILLYPNPEPKKPNKRWHAMPFMEKMIACLKPGGSISMTTNIESYQREARQFFTEVWQLEPVRVQAFTKDNPPEGAPRSHFEKKYLARMDVCYDLEYRKPSLKKSGPLGR